VVSFTPQPLYPLGKRPRYPLDRRLGVPQSRSGRRGEVKFLDLTGTRIRHLSRPARSQSLYRLRYPGSFLIDYVKINLNTINFRCLAPPGPKGCQIFYLSRYQNVIPNVYLGIRNNLTDGPNHIIRHFISCPVLPAALLVRFLHYLRDTVNIKVKLS
jgi:hypothetical protein